MGDKRRALTIRADQFEDSEPVDTLQSLEETGREILKKIHSAKLYALGS